MSEAVKNPLAPYEKQIDIKERKQIIAKMLKALRSGKGYLQKDVSEILGIPLTTYGNYEKAVAEPPAEILVRLSFLYNVPIDVIVGRDTFFLDAGNIAKMQLEAFEQQVKVFEDEVVKAINPENKESKMMYDFIKAIKDLTGTMKETNEIRTKMKENN